jgi:predicted transcriptional regulator
MKIILTQNEIKKAVLDFLNKKLESPERVISIQSITLHRKSRKSEDIGSLTIIIEGEE